MRSIVFLVLLLLGPTALAQTTEQITLQRYADIVLRSSNKRKVLNEEERKQVLSHVINHPVASLLNPDNIKKYDPDGVIGFCFGRAMAVHLAARKVGLQNQSIRKIFIIGDMRSGDQPEWRFHVTTIVKGDDQQWYTLDPIAAWGSKPRVLSVEHWAAWVRSVWDRPAPGKQGRTNIYLVDPDFIIPNLLVVPAIGEDNQTDIMSTTFDPSSKTSYAALSGPERFYTVRFDEQLRQFIGVRERGMDRFSFSTIKVNGFEPYSYNNYFHDLLTVFNKTTEQDILNGASERHLYRSQSLETLQRTNRAVRQRNSLGSPILR